MEFISFIYFQYYRDSKFIYISYYGIDRNITEARKFASKTVVRKFASLLKKTTTNIYEFFENLKKKVTFQTKHKNYLE